MSRRFGVTFLRLVIAREVEFFFSVNLSQPLLSMPGPSFTTSEPRWGEAKRALDDLRKMLPRPRQLMIPIVKALNELGGSGSNQELHDKVVEELKLPDEVRDIPTGGGQSTLLRSNMGWANTYLKAAGIVDNPIPGLWVLKDHGKTLTEAEAEAARRPESFTGSMRRSSAKFERTPGTGRGRACQLWERAAGEGRNGGRDGQQA